MSYLFKNMAILASCLIMAACGLQRSAQYTNVAGYPYRHADFDYKYAWKTATTDQGVVIDGVMKNVRYPSIDSVQMTIVVLGKDGKIIARASTFPMLQQTRENDVCHFNLLLRDIKPAPDDVFHFLVHYRGNEGGSVEWHSSFRVDALTGAVIRPPSRNPDEW
jgi:hypothetical protein